MSQVINKAKDFVADKIAHIKKPEADVADVDINHVSRDSATFNCRVTISNPYGHDLPIGDVSYNLYSAGKEIASGTMLDPGSITANKTTDLNIPIKVPYNLLFNIAKDVGSDWDIDYKVKLGFGMDLPVIGKFTLPLSKEGEVKLPTLSDFF